MSQGTDEVTDQFTANVAWQRELATHSYMLGGDVDAARADTATDLLHINVEGMCHGLDGFLAMVASGNGVRHLGIDAGPGEAIVLSPDAVLISYGLTAHLAVADKAMAATEQASILWMRRAGDWQTVFIHATPLVDAAPRFADPGANGRLATVIAFTGDDHAFSDAVIAERKAQAFASEQAAVDSLRRHDVATAAAAIHPNCIVIESDGSRCGRDAWPALVGDRLRTLGATQIDLIDVIAVAPHAMLVVYTMTSEGDYAGAPFHLAEALSALWVCQGSTWQCVFTQVTLHQTVRRKAM